MSQNHIQLYYFHSALLQIFKSPPNDTVDKCYALLLEKGMESFQNNQSSKKKKSKSRLNLFEETVTDLPDPQSQSVVAASMKEINNILEPTIKGSTIRTEMIDPKLITVSEFKNAFYKIIQLEYPDDFMMRFIRARKYHLRKALDMMIKAIKFQIVFHVEKIRMIGDTKLPAKELSGKSFVYNSDQDGRPILYVNTAMHDKNGASYSEMEEVAVYIMETLRCFVRHPVSNIILVFNMTNFGVQNMDNGLTKFITACTQDYYPESLYKCFVVNAPWVFNSFWKIIKNWLDPVVQAKIEFVSDEELRKHLPHLPKILNPDSNFEYNYCPPKDIDYKFVDSRNKEEKQRLLNEYLDVTLKFEDCTKEWIRLHALQQSNTTSEEELHRNESVVDLHQEKLSDYQESITLKRVLRKSSTHSSLESFISAKSDIVFDETELDFTKATNFQEIDEIRSKIIQHMHLKYIAFDRYVRCPTHYHRAKHIIRDGAKDKIVWNK